MEDKNMRLSLKFVAGLIASLTIGLCFISSTRAQIAGPHFGTWSALELVTAVSQPGQTEYANSLSHDGQRFYFMRGGDIYVAHRADQASEWGDIVELPDTVNTLGTEQNAFETIDGHWLYFGSTRLGGVGGSDIWVSWRKNVHDDQGWQQAVNVTAVNTPGFENAPILFENKETGATELYFAASPPCPLAPCLPGTGTQAGADIYISVLGPNGFGPPQIVTDINDVTHHDGKPYLRRDGLELIFESYRLGPPPMSTGGAIFVATRSSTVEAWGEVNLIIQGPAVGSGMPGDRWITTPVLSRDAETLYVAVNEPGTDYGDIYVAHREKITGPK
jgi:hypothetical protein